MPISTPYAIQAETIAQLKALPSAQRVRKFTILVFETKAWYSYDPDTTFTDLPDQVCPNDNVGVWWRLSTNSIGSYKTAASISAYRALALDSNKKVIYADSNDNPVVVGISLNAVGSNGNVLSISEGVMYDSSFSSFTKGSLIYLGLNGVLTTIVPNNALFICKLGTYWGSNQIKLNIAHPIKQA